MIIQAENNGLINYLIFLLQFSLQLQVIYFTSKDSYHYNAAQVECVETFEHGCFNIITNAIYRSQVHEI